MDIRREIETAVGLPLSDISPLGGGCVGQVYRVRLVDGATLVAKVDDGTQPRLATEGFMLRYLAEQSALPLPTVYYSDPRLLLLQFLPGNSQFDPRAERHAAELLAGLHGQTAAAFGLAQDTLIGGLVQPNGWSDSWVAFFRERRLRYMALAAVREGRLKTAVLLRIERLCADLHHWLLEPERPSLIHGDVWTTNLLAANGRISGFLDPAIYYAHPEVELAFITLFGTFGEPFFRRYQELRPIAPGFFETRRDVYNLYPLLVHVRLFGGSYETAVDRTLHRLGY